MFYVLILLNGAGVRSSGTATLNSGVIWSSADDEILGADAGDDDVLSSTDMNIFV